MNIRGASVRLVILSVVICRDTLVSAAGPSASSQILSWRGECRTLGVIAGEMIHPLLADSETSSHPDHSAKVYGVRLEGGPPPA